jgi:hypothetical protein
MRKLSFVLTVFVLFLLSLNSNAQDTKNFFVGKWKVLTVGTPNGDATSIVTLEQKDGKLTGDMSGMGTTETIKFTNVEEKENSVTVYFNASGYDVYMTLEKKDDNHVTGSMMDMFDVSGERVTEEAAK